jgi:hypothetical protein
MLKPLQSKTAAACARVLMAGHWLAEHEQAFRALLELVREACELYLPDPLDELCILTDASHLHWSALHEPLSSRYESAWTRGRWICGSTRSLPAPSGAR